MSSGTVARLKLRAHSRDGAVAAALFAVTLAARLVTAADHPTEWDSAQLALGLDYFDVAEQSPHPPGYWLYVASGRLVRGLTPLGGHDSLVVVAAVLIAAGVAVAWFVGAALGSRILGGVVCMFLITSPWTWFYGSTANSYAVEVPVTAALVLFAIRARPGTYYGVAAAATLGIGAGFRPSSLVLLAPIAAIAVVRSSRGWRSAAGAALAGGAAVALWLVPLVVEQPGGFATWKASTERLWEEAADKSAAHVDGAKSGDNMGRTIAETLVAVAPLLPLAVGWLILAARRSWRRPPPAESRRVPLLLGAAVLPPFLSSMLLHFGKSGYVLGWLFPLTVLLTWPLARLRAKPALVLGAVALVGVAVSGQRFLTAPGVLPGSLVGELGLVGDPAHFAPYRLTLGEIRQVDARTERFQGIGKEFDPEHDVLVWALGNGGDFYRQGTYTLSVYTCDLAWGPRVAMRASHGRWAAADLDRIEVPPGGRAVFILDSIPPDLAPLSRPTSTGAPVIVAGPRDVVLGVPVIEVADPYDPASDPTNWP